MDNRDSYESMVGGTCMLLLEHLLCQPQVHVGSSFATVHVPVTLCFYIDMRNNIFLVYQLIVFSVLIHHIHCHVWTPSDSLKSWILLSAGEAVSTIPDIYGCRV